MGNEFIWDRPFLPECRTKPADSVHRDVPRRINSKEAAAHPHRGLACEHAGPERWFRAVHVFVITISPLLPPHSGLPRVATSHEAAWSFCWQNHHASSPAQDRIHSVPSKSGAAAVIGRL